MGSPQPVLASVLLAALLLAGCSGGGGGGGGPDDLTPDLDVTSTTGGIRGVVVDEAVRPIKGATVEITNPAKSVTTDETGVFTFSGLEPGTYFVKASHPLYDVQQQNVEVEAGVADPKPVKFLLTRVVLQDPFYQTLKYDGFVVCSINVVTPIGGILSEECGEGVGVPAEECVQGTCVPVPVVGGQRVGGQDGNNVQFDFTIGAGVKTMIVEKHWEATSEAGIALFSPIATEWSCLPVCSGNRMADIDGESPLYVAIDNATLESAEIIPDETVISIFTWASPSYTGASLNQRYTDFVTLFYHVPAPEGWSFVNGDPSPY